MDPISGIVTVADLISFASDIIRFSYTCVSGIREYKREVEAITSETTQLCGILQAIKPIINRSDTVPHYAPSLTMRDATVQKPALVRESDLIDCEQILQEIMQVLQDLSPQTGEFWKNAGRKVRWSLQTVPLQTLLGRLERSKTAFILAFCAYGT